MVHSFLKTAAVASALAIASVSAASAATAIGASPSPYTDVGIIQPTNGSVRFDYVASENISIDSFSLAGTGGSAGGDVRKVQISAEPTGSTTVFTVTDFGTTSSGVGSLAGFQVSAGNAFAILFEVIAGQSLVGPVGVSLTFTANEAPAPVPVPAAGVMLVSALGAAGVALRRKKKTA